MDTKIDTMPEKQELRKILIFDMYGVILKESKGNFIPYVYSYFPETKREYLVSQFTKAGLGEIDSNELMISLGFENPIYCMKEYIGHYLTVDPGFYHFARRYGEAYEFVLLSNDVLAWNQYILEYYGLNRYFAMKVVSSEVHLRKPDPKIFQLTLSKVGVEPGECLFIDNSVKNLYAARECHIDTVLFNRDHVSFDGKTVDSFEELTELIMRMEKG